MNINCPKHILVLGGTGAMGKPLVNELTIKFPDAEVYVTSRKKRESKNERIIYIQGNAHDEAFLSNIIKSRSWDCVIDFLVYSSSSFKPHVNLIIPRTKQYIFISSCRVFAEVDGFITESSPRLLDVSEDKEFLQTDEYALAKAKEENYLKQFPNVTIVRPSVTFNSNRLQLGVYEVKDWLHRPLNGHSIVFSKDIASHITTLTFGDDVARGISALVCNPSALGEDFNIVTSEYFYWEEIFNLYREVLAKNGYSNSYKMIDTCPNLKVKGLKYQVKYARLFDRKYDNSKFLNAVPGFKFSDVKESLVSCLGQYLNNQSTFPLSTNLISLLQDRDSGDHLKYKEFNSLVPYIKYRLKVLLPEKIFYALINR